jgi:surface antigen
MARLYGFLHWAFLVLMAAGVAGCATAPDFAQMPREPGRSVVENSGQKPLQCAPYARDHSAVKIHGDAWTWWDQAEGKFSRGTQPQMGAVMVLNNYAGSQRGHVAVVRKIVSPREIRVDHANWLDDGSIYLNNPVEDVSAENDWSKVRVYNIKTGGWGSNIYPVQGFIGGSNSDSVLDGRVAPRNSPKDNLPGDSVLDRRAAPRNENALPSPTPRTEPDSDIDSLLQASMTPKPVFKPLAKAPARAMTAPAAPTDESLAPPGSTPDAAVSDGNDPLPHPDMVISANFPPGR